MAIIIPEQARGFYQALYNALRGNFQEGGARTKCSCCNTPFKSELEYTLKTREDEKHGNYLEFGLGLIISKNLHSASR